MATAKKKKTSSIGQVSYLTKQVKDLGTELIRKEIKQLKTELKKDIKHLKSNNKIILGILAVLVTAIFYLHSDTNKRFDRIENRFDKRFDRIENRFDKRFDRVERAIENINQKLK